MLALCREHVDAMVRVDVDGVCAAIKDVYGDTRSVLEPAGALAVAGLKEWTGGGRGALIAVTGGATAAGAAGRAPGRGTGPGLGRAAAAGFGRGADGVCGADVSCPASEVCWPASWDPPDSVIVISVTSCPPRGHPRTCRASRRR